MTPRTLKASLLGPTLVVFSLISVEAWARGPGGAASGMGASRGGAVPSHVGAGSSLGARAPSSVTHAPNSVPHVPSGVAPGHSGSPLSHGSAALAHPGFHSRNPSGGYGYHEAMLHSAGPHWNGYHQAFIGSHPVHLAWAGYRPSYYYHPWYHGPWCGYGFGWGWGFGPGVAFGVAGAGWGLSVGAPLPYGPYGYWGYPLGWGYGGWGLGTVVYTSGYYPYYNPYYSPVVYQTVVYDYSRPIPVAIRRPEGTSPTSTDALTHSIDPAFDAARDAFRVGDHRNALIHVDRAIARDPGDAVFHEFRALTLFARRDYRQAAATLHSLLAVGPGWDWTTMTSLYGVTEDYTAQLRELERYARSNPEAADAHFVLGYHYMVMGHKESAAIQLQSVVTLQPADRLTLELLRMVQGPTKVKNVEFDDLPNLPSVDAPVAPELGSIDQNLLTGIWHATRSDGSKFVLSLTDENTFDWKYVTPGRNGDQFTGTFSVDGPVLILQRKEGGALTGTVTFGNDNEFLFKLVGAPPDDKGLTFTK